MTATAPDRRNMCLHVAEANGIPTEEELYRQQRVPEQSAPRQCSMQVDAQRLQQKRARTRSRCVVPAVVAALALLPIRVVSTAGEALSNAEKRLATIIGILTCIDGTDSSQFDGILNSEIVLYHWLLNCWP